MKVIGKDLKVRRLDDGNTVWLWYCTLRRKWHKYGDKVDGVWCEFFTVSISLSSCPVCWWYICFLICEQDSKGNTNPVKCSDIERKFQSNPKSSFTFNIGSETLEIKFRGGARSQKSLHMQHSSCTTSFVSFSDTSLIFFFFVCQKWGRWGKKKRGKSLDGRLTDSSRQRQGEFGFWVFLAC